MLNTTILQLEACKNQLQAERKSRIEKKITAKEKSTVSQMDKAQKIDLVSMALDDLETSIQLLKRV